MLAARMQMMQSCWPIGTVARPDAAVARSWLNVVNKWKVVWREEAFSFNCLIRCNQWPFTQKPQPGNLKVVLMLPYFGNHFSPSRCFKVESLSARLKFVRRSACREQGPRTTADHQRNRSNQRLSDERSLTQRVGFKPPIRSSNVARRRPSPSGPWNSPVNRIRLRVLQSTKRFSLSTV